MAKLVDALCSGRSVRKDVLVRIQFWARVKAPHFVRGFFYVRSQKLASGSGQQKAPGSQSDQGLLLVAPS